MNVRVLTVMAAVCLLAAPAMADFMEPSPMSTFDVSRRVGPIRTKNYRLIVTDNTGTGVGSKIKQRLTDVLEPEHVVVSDDSLAELVSLTVNEYIYKPKDETDVAYVLAGCLFGIIPGLIVIAIDEGTATGEIRILSELRVGDKRATVEFHRVAVNLSEQAGLAAYIGLLSEELKE